MQITSIRNMSFGLKTSRTMETFLKNSRANIVRQQDETKISSWKELEKKMRNVLPEKYTLSLVPDVNSNNNIFLKAKGEKDILLLSLKNGSLNLEKLNELVTKLEREKNIKNKNSGDGEDYKLDW